LRHKPENCLLLFDIFVKLHQAHKPCLQEQCRNEVFADIKKIIKFILFYYIGFSTLSSLEAIKTIKTRCFCSADQCNAVKNNRFFLSAVFVPSTFPFLRIKENET